jgi:CBS-domain-containing membrane protein
MFWVRERTVPTEGPPLVDEVVPTFADIGSHVVSVTDPYGRIVGFLDRSCYFSIK